MRIRTYFDNVRMDARHAVRSLRRSPGFAAVALLALAVGIGGNTAVFSVIDATRVQAIPYEDPERLVNLIGNVDRGAIERRGASYPDFVDCRAHATRSFEDRVRSWEGEYLWDRAMPSYPAIRREPEPDSLIRTPFQRDRDRIVHSKAFRRLKHKTQVFIAPPGSPTRSRPAGSLGRCPAPWG